MGFRGIQTERIRRLRKLIRYDYMVLGPDDCPLFYCWRLKVGPISFRMHRFVKGSPPEVQHNHSWWFITLVLKGSYLDVTPNGVQRMRAGRIAFRSANHRHSVVDCEGCWTFVINGPTVRADVDWWLHGERGTFTEAQRAEAAFACLNAG